MFCPCTSGLPYKSCCEPYHRGVERPLPLPLMRSRFAAYALGKVRYIVQTEDRNSPNRKDDAQYRRDIKRFCGYTKFIGLQILDEEQLSDTQATVTFRAVLSREGKDTSFTEQSLFEKVNDRWYYMRSLKTFS